MTVGAMVQALSERFQAVSDSPRLDARLLTGKVLQRNAAWILANAPRDLEAEELAAIEALALRRETGECIAYLLGEREFYGRNFLVGPGVLVPRPETEILVEWLLEDYDDAPRRLLDICTGTGCIPLTLALERPRWQIAGSDISPDALDWACRNRQALQVPQVELFLADALSTIADGSLDLISANPPYVPGAETSARLAEGWTEPRLALDGGPDGLDFYRRFFPELLRCLCPGGRGYVEIGDGQAPALMRMAADCGFAEVLCRSDLQELPRTLRLTKSPNTVDKHDNSR